jgi:uncharacterized membrane protein
VARRLLCTWSVPLIVTLTSVSQAQACPNCELGRQARSEVWTSGFGANLIGALLPFLVVAITSVRVGSFARPRSVAGGIVSAGVFLGTGLGGFFDGILLHQILQWHNMLSSVRPPADLVSMKYNMVWDGLFHAFTWLMTSLGVWRLWRAGQRTDVVWSARTFVGSLVLGWGLFNFIEGLVDHQLLGIHHVHPGEGQLAWDLGFLAFGLLQIAAGFASIRVGGNGPARSE